MTGHRVICITTPLSCPHLLRYAKYVWLHGRAMVLLWPSPCFDAFTAASLILDTCVVGLNICISHYIFYRTDPCNPHSRACVVILTIPTAGGMLSMFTLWDTGFICLCFFLCARLPCFAIGYVLYGPVGSLPTLPYLIYAKRPLCFLLLLILCARTQKFISYLKLKLYTYILQSALDHHCTVHITLSLQPVFSRLWCFSWHCKVSIHICLLFALNGGFRRYPFVCSKFILLRGYDYVHTASLIAWQIVVYITLGFFIWLCIHMIASADTYPAKY